MRPSLPRASGRWPACSHASSGTQATERSLVMKGSPVRVRASALAKRPVLFSLFVAAGAVPVSATEAVGQSPAGRIPACGPARLDLFVATDRRRYTRGEPIPITVGLRSRTRAACLVRTGACLPQIVVSSASGRAVWNRAQTRVICGYGVWRELGRGRMLRKTVTWDGRRCVRRDPQGCPLDLPPPGRYSVNASWETARVVRTTVVLR